MRPIPSALCATTIALLVSGSVLAHDQVIPIAAKKLRVQTLRGPAKQRMGFTATNQVAILPGHDPVSETTWVHVGGMGPSGGQSGKIVLDASKWRRSGSGYKYLDRDAARGGIRKVLYRFGKLVISAKGARWTWRPAGAQDEVWVHFGIEDETYCARFGGDVSRNEAGWFQSRNAGSPGACPESVCGNGAVELGEECDDGNLDDDDGCTSACTQGACAGQEFSSTFEGIQSVVFDGNGCSTALCHGSSPGQGNLDLSAGVAYQELFEVPSTGSSFMRVWPAGPRQSSLWLKLALATDPTIDIPGAPMPVGLPPVDGDLLDAVRLWIEHGAPETGTVPGTESLLGGCFPEPQPITIEPLDPPAPNEGVQIVMPPHFLAAQTEQEICFATYYNWTDQVPAQFKDPGGEFFYVNDHETRADPHTHHLVLINSGVPVEDIHHPSFGAWTCVGGPSDGQVCEPTDLGSCGGGICRSEVRPSVACIGFGPPGGGTANDASVTLGGAGNGQPSGTDPIPGRFRKIPLEGIVYWNSHAFNLTSSDHMMNARSNLYFTDDLRFEVVPFLDYSHIYMAAGTPPYTKATYCADHTMSEGAQLAHLSSHTHKRGEAFWIDVPDGTRIYQSFVYSDPVTEVYDPPLVFDSPNPALRRLHYCATYNNGVDADGLPDPTTVRRRSTTPSSGSPCAPVACAAGRVGAPCGGVGDDATCDSFTGAGDGFCDACAITAGLTTEDEMFILVGATIVDVP
jgi:cysteine-rich repeat protein